MFCSEIYVVEGREGESLLVFHGSVFVAFSLNSLSAVDVLAVFEGTVEWVTSRLRIAKRPYQRLGIGPSKPTHCFNGLQNFVRKYFVGSRSDPFCIIGTLE